MKVLIISHNPITTYQNMGKTLLSLFSSFEKRELCQLYIYPTIPDIDICNSYYRVTDRDVLRSYFQFGKVNSRIMSMKDIDTTQHSVYENEEEAGFYKKKKKNALTLLCRDLMWSLSGWYSLSLKNWLDEEKPTCIFLAPGESKFIYDIALTIANKLNIDIFTYICDEFYFVEKPHKLFDTIQLNLLKKKMKKLLCKSKGIITICAQLAEIYHDEFKTKTHTIYTGTNYPIASATHSCSELKGVVYMGNLNNKRYEAIADIGRVLDEINIENGTNYKVFLYTTPIRESIQQVFLQIESIQYSGYVTGKEFENVLHHAGLLLHVESFNPQAMECVKHSVSTKIADCLGSGALLFAYGPEQIASIQHLIQNRCAIVVTQREEIKSALYKVLFERNYQEIVKNALSTAEIYHTSDKNSMVLKNVLLENEI